MEIINQWLAEKASKVSHAGVAKSVYLEAEITAGYFLVLTLANLIALSGLIMNNSAVIIGSMLISPLMGPILSSGYGYITVNTVIWEKSIKKIGLSVALTVVVAAAVTYLSPLKEITVEILARTSPNLYDLVVAFLAGTVGAIALCTKKNYLITVTGVAIATAVIPPLSVVGFGIGTGDLYIAVGGFFLFFTNFVAIIISTCIVFFIYGFRPGMLTAATIPQIKKRFISLALTLFLISLPLFYTLHASISEIRLKSGILNILKGELDREGVSHISTMDLSRGKDDAFSVQVTVNTVSYLKEDELNATEGRLEKYLGRDVKLGVEQIIVHTGGLKKEAVTVQPLRPALSERTVEKEQKTAIEDTSAIMRKASTEIEKVISPSVITEFYIGQSQAAGTLAGIVKVKRDQPLSAVEQKWLARMFSNTLKVPLELQVETVPFFQPIVFGRAATALAEESKGPLSIAVKEVYGRDPEVTFMIDSYPGVSERDGRKLAARRGREVAAYLAGEFKIPSSRIKTAVRRETMKTPMIRVSVLPDSVGVAYGESR